MAADHAYRRLYQPGKNAENAVADRQFRIESKQTAQGEHGYVGSIWVEIEPRTAQVQRDDCGAGRSVLN